MATVNYHPETRRRCTACHTVVSESQMLRKPNPFDPREDLEGCPSCKAPFTGHFICEVSGCYAASVAGDLCAEDGKYRFLCHEHSQELHRQHVVFYRRQLGEESTSTASGDTYSTDVSSL